MKYLKKYSLFERFSKENKIFENYNKFGTKTLTEVEFDQIRKENCKNWTKAETSLYRGMPDLGDYLYIDPRKGGGRSSIEDVNVHIELLSNLPCWKDYPSYVWSIIGISSEAGARGYGEVYEIIPFDDSKIAVCPEADIWTSFGNEESGWGGDIDLVKDFLGELDIDYDCWEQFGGSTIQSKLKSIEKIEINSSFTIESFFKRMKEEGFIKSYDNMTGEICYKFISEFLFNPKERRFSLVNYEPEFKIEKNKQIWTEGPVLLIKSKLS
jgi:hypothetical protein